MDTIEQDLAVKIVEKLFKNSNNRQADKLLLQKHQGAHDYEILGGWCRESAIEQVRQVLSENLKI